MDEQEQQRLMKRVLDEHARNPHPELAGPRLRLHVTLHVVVETQLRKGQPRAVVETLRRLMDEGLDRHEAVHAIASIVAEQVVQTVGQHQHYDEAEYVERLERLTADGWRAQQAQRARQAQRGAAGSTDEPPG